MTSRYTRLNNLLALLDRYGSRKALGEAIGMSAPMLSQILSERPTRSIGDRMARRIELAAGLPEGWMDQHTSDTTAPAIKGYEDGVPLPKHLADKYPDVASKTWRRSAATAAGHIDLAPISAWDDSTPLDDDEVSVPFLKEVELSAGPGRTVIEETTSARLRFGRSSLKRHNVDPENAVCVPIRGNSMEPVLRNGATVGVDRGTTAIADGDLYAINHAGQLRVKQLYRLPHGIRVRSFNRDEFPDEEYSWDELVEQEFSVIGRVFWWAMFA